MYPLLKQKNKILQPYRHQAGNHSDNDTDDDLIIAVGDVRGKPMDEPVTVESVISVIFLKPAHVGFIDRINTCRLKYSSIHEENPQC